jgi:hypothetical protein
MSDRALIAAILLVTIGLIQITSFIMGHNGQVVIVTSNVIIGIMAYYFGVKRPPQK